MACRLPVVASTAAGEIADRVRDGYNGFLVPPADSSRLMSSMQRLAGDGALRRRMGEASWELVAHQTPDVWAEAFEEAVERIFAMPRARHEHAGPAAAAHPLAGAERR
jgi:glycosyltransferase involved in cell wall biosynthesis